MIPEIIHLLPPPGSGPGRETIEPILSVARGTLEHIVSRGQPSPPGFWYDQPQSEWLALLNGNATLEFETGALHLRAGDSLSIPPRLRHRVSFSSEDAVWLAFHHQ